MIWDFTSFSIVFQSYEANWRVISCVLWKLVYCWKDFHRRKSKSGTAESGQLGLRPTVSWAQHVKGRVCPSPFAALSFRDLKQVVIYAKLTERVLQLLDGEA